MKCFLALLLVLLSAHGAQAKEAPRLKACAAWESWKDLETAPSWITRLDPGGFETVAPNTLRLVLPPFFTETFFGAHRFQNSYTLCHRNTRFRNYGLLPEYAKAEGWWLARMEQGNPVLYLTDPDDDRRDLYLEYDGGRIDRATALQEAGPIRLAPTVGERLNLPREPKRLRHYPYRPEKTAWVRVEARGNTVFALGANGVHISDWRDLFELAAATDPLFFFRRTDDPAVVKILFDVYRSKGLLLTRGSFTDYPSALAVGLAAEGHCGTLVRHGEGLLTLLGYQGFRYGLADDSFGHTLLFAQQSGTRLVVDSYFLEVVPVPDGLPAGDRTGTYQPINRGAGSAALRTFYLNAPRRIFYKVENPDPEVLHAERLVWRLNAEDVLLYVAQPETARVFLGTPDPLPSSRVALLTRTVTTTPKSRMFEVPFPLRRIEATPDATGPLSVNGQDFASLAAANAWLSSVPPHFAHTVHLGESYAGATVSLIIEANGALVPLSTPGETGDLTVEVVDGRTPRISFHAP